MLMVTKLDRMVTYHEGLLHINSNDALITWSCKITWQTKTIISPQRRCLWPPALEGWLLNLDGLQPIKSLDPLITWFFRRSRDKPNHYISTTTEPMATTLTMTVAYLEGLLSYSHITLNQVVLLDHVTIWKIYISTFSRLLATKLGRALDSRRRFITQTF